MAAHRVQRLAFAEEALGGAGIHHGEGGLLYIGQHGCGVDAIHQRRADGEAAGTAPPGFAAERVAGLAPGGDAAVEHGDGGMAEPTQQPPGTGGVLSGHIVVGDHLGARRHADGAEVHRQPAPSGKGWRPLSPVLLPDRW